MLAEGQQPWCLEWETHSFMTTSKCSFEYLVQNIILI